MTSKVIGFVENTRAGVLGSLGLALLLYTVVSLLQKIERAFNYTWRVSHHRPITQRFSDYITVVLVGPVLLFSALGVTASVSSVSLILLRSLISKSRSNYGNGFLEKNRGDGFLLEFHILKRRGDFKFLLRVET